EELRPPQFPQAPDKPVAPAFTGVAGAGIGHLGRFELPFFLPPPASESSRWRLWDAKLLPYVVLVNTKPQYIVHICILTPDTPQMFLAEHLWITSLSLSQ